MRSSASLYQWELERPQSSSPPSHTNCDILALSETWLNLPETLEARHQKEENYALKWQYILFNEAGQRKKSCYIFKGPQKLENASNNFIFNILGRLCLFEDGASEAGRRRDWATQLEGEAVRNRQAQEVSRRQVRGIVRHGFGLL